MFNFIGILNFFLFLIYDILFFFVLIIYLPFGFVRNKISFKSLKEKFGLLDYGEDSNTIWIHAVSVGEVNLIGNLIIKLKQTYDCPIIISTTTLTGNKVAKMKYTQYARIIFLPFDISFILKKVLDKINPEIFISAETEIWPNLFRFLNKYNVPIIIINGRISDKAFMKYTLIKNFIGKVLNKCRAIGVQNGIYKNRFLSLGAKKDKVFITGNMKFGALALDNDRLKKIKENYLPVFKKNNQVVFISASTHSPEEEIILNIYKDLLKNNLKTTLIIAPRHPERVVSIENIIKSYGFNPVKTSDMISSSFKLKKNDIFIIDTVGELLGFLNISDICFVGGSFSNDGGHNILEPIYFLKPTLFGPNMDNFREIEEVVLKEGVALKMADIDEFKETLTELIQNEELRKSYSNKCLSFLEHGKEGLEKNFQLISNSISAARQKKC